MPSWPLIPNTVGPLAQHIANGPLPKSTREARELYINKSLYATRLPPTQNILRNLRPNRLSENVFCNLYKAASPPPFILEVGQPSVSPPSTHFRGAPVPPCSNLSHRLLLALFYRSNKHQMCYLLLAKLISNVCACVRFCSAQLGGGVT